MSTPNPQQTKKTSESFKNIWRFFGETLGTWNAAPVDLELKDDAKPVGLLTYPVQRVHEAMYRKEVEKLVKLGVLKESNHS